MELMWDACQKCGSIDIAGQDRYDLVCKTCGSKEIQSYSWDSHTNAWNDPKLGEYLKQSGKTIDDLLGMGKRILQKAFPGASVQTAREAEEAKS